jgi:hypothetical protein
MHLDIGTVFFLLVVIVIAPIYFGIMFGAEKSCEIKQVLLISSCITGILSSLMLLVYLFKYKNKYYEMLFLFLIMAISFTTIGLLETIYKSDLNKNCENPSEPPKSDSQNSPVVNTQVQVQDCIVDDSIKDSVIKTRVVLDKYKNNSFSDQSDANNFLNELNTVLSTINGPDICNYFKTMLCILEKDYKISPWVYENMKIYVTTIQKNFKCS